MKPSVSDRRQACIKPTLHRLQSKHQKPITASPRTNHCILRHHQELLTTVNCTTKLTSGTDKI